MSMQRFATILPDSRMTNRPEKIENVMGAVLAGGASRRMGQDKAMMELDGQTLLGRAVLALQGVLKDVVVVAPGRQRYRDPGAPVIPDIRAGLGPLGGIHAALVHGAGRSIFVLACDMPLVTADLVRWVMDSGEVRSLVRVVRDRNGAQPLCGWYSGSILPAVQRALEEDRLSARMLLNDLDTEYLDLDTRVPWYRPNLLANVNELRDFAQVTPRPDPPSPRATTRRTVVRHERQRATTESDLVTVEEPLEIRVVAEIEGRRRRESVAVTMRTPGEDLDLAAGFLVSEGVVKQSEDIWQIEHCRNGDGAVDDNVVDVHLAPSVKFDLDQLSRRVITSSACGICGRSSIESVQQICTERPNGRFRLRPEEISELPKALQAVQGVFTHTGGIHAAALFSPVGELLKSCEDVGRHNALDKLVGGWMEKHGLPAADKVVLVSGRASFELVQKCLLAGIPVLAAVGAPSSLAVDLAAEYDMTLIGFLRDGRFNVYSGGHRIEES